MPSGLLRSSLHESVVGDHQQALVTLFAAVSFVMLVGGANVSNLLLARGIGRRAELAVRAALGASRARIVRLLLAETVVLATIGTVVGLVFATLMLPGLVQLAGDNVPRLADARVSSTTLGFSVAVAFLAAIVTGLIPALRHSRTDLQSALVRTTLPTDQIVPMIRRELRSVSADLSTANLRLLEDVVGESMRSSRFSAFVISAFAVAALLLSALGVFGVFAFGVASRVREVGIRMALGATGSEIARMFLTQAAGPIAIGVVFGTAGAIALGRLVDSLLFGVAPTDVTSVGSRKFVAIRPAQHPVRRRCSSFTYAQYARSSRLAGRAHRRPRCFLSFTPSSAPPRIPIKASTSTSAGRRSD